MKNQIITDIRQALKDSVDEKTKFSYGRFFKEEVKAYGVRTAEVTKIGKLGFEKIKCYSKLEIFELCEELWKSGYNEEAYIACNWSDYLYREYEPADFKVFEHWVNKYVSNWATCDTLCNHTIGTFVTMHSEYIVELKKWATSANRWMKRASAVTLIIPARKGLYLKDALEIANILLFDKDNMVQKGYGWMLKAASETNQQAVFDYVLSKKTVMPRTALRYAIEKMPQQMKMKIMRK